MSVPDIDWQNRPTFQQVVQFGQPIGETPDDGDRGPGRDDGAVLPTTGGRSGLALLGLVLLVGALTLRRRA